MQALIGYKFTVVFKTLLQKAMSRTITRDQTPSSPMIHLI